MKKILIIIWWIFWIFFIIIWIVLHYSTITYHTTKVNESWNPIEEEKNQKQTTIKKDDNNSKYVVYNSNWDWSWYWIYNLKWENVWNIRDIYLYAENSNTWKTSQDLLFINNGSNQYIFNDFLKLIWKVNLPNTEIKAFLNKTNNKIYFINKSWVIYDAYWNSYSNFNELKFLNWNIILTENWWKKVLLSDDLKPLTKNSFDSFSSYYVKYKSKDLIIYSFRIGNTYYLKYLNNNILTDIDLNSEWFQFEPKFSIHNDKLYFIDNNQYIKYYDLSLDKDNQIKIWNLNSEKVPFDVNTVNLDANWKKYTSKILKWLWEYNWKIYLYAFGFERRSCSVFWGCDNYMEYDNKFLNSNWENINKWLDDKLYEELPYNYWDFGLRINMAMNRDINFYWDDNYIELNKSNDFWEVKNYIWLYDNWGKISGNELTLWGNNFKIESWLDTENIKNENWEFVLSGVNEIKWIIKNENIINLRINNKGCLYKEISWRFVQYYCSDKWILLYKNWYILEWEWYSGDFWKLVDKKWTKTFEKVDFKDKSWKSIVVSEFNSEWDYILLVDLENNFYLYNKEKLIFSGKRMWQDDLKIFLFNKEIIDELLKN